MKILTPAEAGYCAALMDGEGCFSLGRFVRKNMNVTYSVSCTISNTNMTILCWLKDTVQAGSICRSAKAKQGYKQSFYWALSVKEIIPFIEQILPYLVAKEEQALLLMEFVRNTRQSNFMSPLSIEEVDAKQYIYDRLRELNKRGI